MLSFRTIENLILNSETITNLEFDSGIVDNFILKPLKYKSKTIRNLISKPLIIKF